MRRTFLAAGLEPSPGSSSLGSEFPRQAVGVRVRANLAQKSRADGRGTLRDVYRRVGPRSRSEAPATLLLSEPLNPGEL